MVVTGISVTLGAGVQVAGGTIQNVGQGVSVFVENVGNAQGVFVAVAIGNGVGIDVFLTDPNVGTKITVNPVKKTSVAVTLGN